MTDNHRPAVARWRLAGMLLALAGMGCALVSAGFALRRGDVMQAVAVAGAGVAFGAIGVSGWLRSRSR